MKSFLEHKDNLIQKPSLEYEGNVSDLVEGLYSTMNCEDIMPINLGNPDEFTIKELAEKVVEILECHLATVSH